MYTSPWAPSPWVITAFGGFELATGKLVCHVAVPSSGVRTILVDGGLVYLSHLGAMTCASPAERRVPWANELPGTGHGRAAIGVPGRSAQVDVTGG